MQLGYSQCIEYEQIIRQLTTDENTLYVRLTLNICFEPTLTSHTKNTIWVSQWNKCSKWNKWRLDHSPVKDHIDAHSLPQNMGVIWKKISRNSLQWLLHWLHFTAFTFCEHAEQPCQVRLGWSFNNDISRLSSPISQKEVPTPTDSNTLPAPRNYSFSDLLSIQQPAFSPKQCCY